MKTIDKLHDLGIRFNTIKNDGPTKTTCPWCSHTRKKNKSEKCLRVWPEEGTYYCHHCGTSGSVQEYETEYEEEDKEDIKKEDIKEDKKQKEIKSKKEKKTDKNLEELKKILSMNTVKGSKKKSFKSDSLKVEDESYISKEQFIIQDRL